jgi:anti-anti-sigma factor
MGTFEAKTAAESGRIVVSLLGECDLTTRDELTSVLLAAVDRADLVVVDVVGLDFLDSSGIHCLVTAYQAAQRAGRRLYLTNARGIVADVLAITGVGDLLSPNGDGTGGPTLG